MGGHCRNFGRYLHAVLGCLGDFQIGSGLACCCHGSGVTRLVSAGVAVKNRKKQRRKLPGFVWQRAAAVSRSRVLGAKTKQASMPWPPGPGQQLVVETDPVELELRRERALAARAELRRRAQHRHYLLRHSSRWVWCLLLQHMLL